MAQGGARDDVARYDAGLVHYAARIRSHGEADGKGREILERLRVRGLFVRP